MPYSTAKFKEETRELLIKKFPRTAGVLDVGPGSGIYADMLGDWFYTIDAIEIFKPYVEKFNLHKKYRIVTVGDITHPTTNNCFSVYDIILFGDVLEHLPIKKAQKLLQEAKQWGCFVVVAVPYMYEQGEEMGNIHETHLQPDLTPDVMAERYPDLKLWLGDETMGIYVFDHLTKFLPLQSRQYTNKEVMEHLLDRGRKELERKDLQYWIANGVHVSHPTSVDQDITFAKMRKP